MVAQNDEKRDREISKEDSHKQFKCILNRLQDRSLEGFEGNATESKEVPAVTPFEHEMFKVVRAAQDKDAIETAYLGNWKTHSCCTWLGGKRYPKDGR